MTALQVRDESVYKYITARSLRVAYSFLQLGYKKVRLPRGGGGLLDKLSTHAVNQDGAVHRQKDTFRTANRSTIKN